MEPDDTPPGPARPARERELASLYAKARSLTALGELDDVLQSIVHHAHELIGTDFTYLSLLDAHDELRLTASEGTISAAFRAAHIPRGVGLGGRVIESRTTLWVRNYLEAHDVEHDSGFDSLVGQEGLVALLGVPLVVGDEAIGALFAAERAERSFRTDEVALLSAFADHAAVALDNARLYDESRAALQRLQAAYRTIEDQVAIMERSQAVHEALTEVVLTGAGPEEVAVQLAEQMGGVVAVLDRDGSTLARRGRAEAPDDPDGSPVPEVTDAIEQARRTGRCATTTDDAAVSHSVAAIQAGDSFLGAVTWSIPEQPGPVDIRTLERATHIMGLLMLKENAVAEAADRLSGELLTELIVGSPSVGPTQRARTRSRGIDVDALNLVVVAESATSSTGEVARRLHPIARQRSGLAGEYLGRATMLVAADDQDDEVAAIHRRLRRELGRPVLVVGERVHGYDWARAFSLASRCSAVARAIGASDVGTTTRSYSLYAMLFDAERSHELDSFISDTIGALIEYDRRRSTDLVKTLSTYYDNGSVLAGTARALHVHMNTLLKRLDRITALLGLDWRRRDDLHLRLAVRMHNLRRTVSATRDE